MDRHDRQAKLAEVGSAGQARIARAVVEVPLVGLAGDIAARYLAGAGVAAVRVREEALASGARALAPAVRVEVAPAGGDGAGEVGPPAQVAPEVASSVSLLRDPAAQELARGALAALGALLCALEASR